MWHVHDDPMWHPWRYAPTPHVGQGIFFEQPVGPPQAPITPLGVNPMPQAQPSQAWPALLTGALILVGGVLVARGLKVF